MHGSSLSYTKWKFQYHVDSYQSTEEELYTENKVGCAGKSAESAYCKRFKAVKDKFENKNPGSM